MPSPLPALPLQYADFAHWQRQWLQGEVLETPAVLLAAAAGRRSCRCWNCPTDRPRPAVQTFQGARQSLLLPTSLTESLKALGQQEGATLFMTLLAAFKLMLQAYTGRDDIVVGTDVANRHRAELEGLMGFFVNLLVLRTDMRGNPTFREFLQRVRQVVLGAYDAPGSAFRAARGSFATGAQCASYPLSAGVVRPPERSGANAGTRGVAGATRRGPQRDSTLRSRALHAGNPAGASRHVEL